MLAVSPLRSAKNEIENEMEKGFSSSMEDQSNSIIEFPDFSGGNLLDSIDFDDLFVGIGDGDLLPDLEMDPHEILAEFSPSAGEESMSDLNVASIMSVDDDHDHHHQHRKLMMMEEEENDGSVVKVEKVGTGSGSGSTSPTQESDEAVSGKKIQEPVGSHHNKEGEKGRKSMSNSKNPHGKRKVKVDWTPELHRRFVQAVEQLGVDKAVPSRILELMGIDCLTRHNIASHLQKYRSHRKHLLAREAEAASWSQRRQMYGAGGGPAAGKRDHVNPWVAPTIGFPPVTPMPHFRPLHVWGHPSVDQSLMPMWPKHLTPSPPPPPHAWPPAQPPHPPPPADPSYWIHHHHHVPTPGTPCFSPHLLPARFPTPPVPGIPPPAMYKVKQALPQPPSDVHPSKESVDAAIGDALSKPWLPLPLGLKPPSVDSVMVELQRQGISKIPPTCA